MSVKPVLSIAIATDTTYTTDRIMKIDQTEEHNSHKAEIVLQDSDGVMTAKDLKGLKVTPAWGFKTSAGDETSPTAPLWVKDMRLESSPGRRLCTLSCIGIPDRLALDKASANYNHDWSSQKTVLDLVTEVASGVAVPEDTIVANLISDNAAGLSQPKTGTADATEAYKLHDADGGFSKDDVGKTLTNTTDSTVTTIRTFVDSGEIDLADDIMVSGENYTISAVYGAGQSFPIDATDDDFTIISVSFRLKKTGLAIGNITFRIDDWAGNSIATKVLADASTLTTSPVWYTVTWALPELIDASVVNGGIWIWVFYNGGDAAKYVSVYYNTSSVKSSQNYALFTGSTPLLDNTNLDCAYKYVVQNGAAGIGVYSHCASWTVTDDTAAGDALLDVYLPGDGFYIREGETRLEVIDRLLNYTKTERRFEDDGEIHLRVPVTTGASYDYEYKLDSGHTFFAKAIRNALVTPNSITVKSFDTDADQYTGTSTSATSYALLRHDASPLRAKLVSNAQAASIAAAWISRQEVASQRGSAWVPMNIGTELFDYVLVTDERASDTRTGNIGYFRRHYDNSGSPDSYRMAFGFGGVATKSVPGTKLSQLYDGISRLEYEQNESNATWGTLLPHLRLYAEAIDSLQNSLGDILIGLDYYNNDLSSALNNVVEDASPQLGGDLDGQSIYKGINFVDPTAAQELATKQYVDDNVNTIVWSTTAPTALTDSNRTTTSNYTDLDLTANTSAAARFALVRCRMVCNSITGTGSARLYIRKNGETPGAQYGAFIDGSCGDVAGAVSSDFQIIGLDAGQIMEWNIIVTGTIDVTTYFNVLGYIE